MRSSVVSTRAASALRVTAISLQLAATEALVAVAELARRASLSKRSKPSPTLATVFDRIYRVNYWRGTESRSGQGSGTDATKALAVRLVDLVAALGVTSVLDVGCGDGFWMPPLPGYIGVDVSEVALSFARARHPEREYLFVDGTPYPRCQLVIARHVMQHLSLAEGTSLLNLVRESGAQWLLATTYLMGRNRDIANGRIYWPDLTAQPFNLGKPIGLLEDEGGAPGGLLCRLGLWPIGPSPLGAQSGRATTSPSGRSLQA